MQIYKINSYSNLSINQTQPNLKQTQPNFRAKYSVDGDEAYHFMACGLTVAFTCILAAFAAVFSNNKNEESIEPQQEQQITAQDSQNKDSFAKTADFNVGQSARQDSHSEVSKNSLDTSCEDKIERISYNTSLPKGKEMKQIVEKLFDSVGFPYRKIIINENDDIKINFSKIPFDNGIFDKSDKAKLYGTNRKDILNNDFIMHQRIDGLIDMAYGYLEKYKGFFDMSGRKYKQGFKIYDPKFQIFYTNEYQIFDNYRKRINVNLDSIDYFKDFNKYMLSSILANYGIYEITDFQLQGNKAVLMCNSIHNKTYKIECSRKNNEIRGITTDNESKKRIAFIYNDESSGEKNLVKISTQEVVNSNDKIEQIAPKNMTYIINEKFYGDEGLRKDGNPTISNDDGFNQASDCIKIYRHMLNNYVDSKQFQQLSRLICDKNGHLKEPGSCMFENIFNTDATDSQKQLKCNSHIIYL